MSGIYNKWTGSLLGNAIAIVKNTFFVLIINFIDTLIPPQDCPNIYHWTNLNTHKISKSTSRFRGNIAYNDQSAVDFKIKKRYWTMSHAQSPKFRQKKQKPDMTTGTTSHAGSET